MYTLPSLPYDFSALEPHIDAETMQLHHGKHHQTYVDKLNAAIEGHDDLASKPVEQLLREFASVPESIKTAVRNHGGGHANHSLFWTILSATPGEISPELAEAIGDLETFKNNFTEKAAGVFGSGWAWLVANPDKTVEIMTTPNQDSPLMEGRTPIMGVDVWEHAYYLKYQNRRPEYLAAFWNVLDWAEVSRRYQEATQ